MVFFYQLAMGDGIGWTAKCLATKASLQMSTSNAINSAEKFILFCKTKIEGIKSWLIKKETFVKVQKVFMPKNTLICS